MDEVQDLIITVRVRFPYAFDRSEFESPQEALQFFIDNESWQEVMGNSDDHHLLGVQAVPSQEVKRE